MLINDEVDYHIFIKLRLKSIFPSLLNFKIMSSFSRTYEIKIAQARIVHITRAAIGLSGAAACQRLS